MEGSIRLSAEERKVLLSAVQRETSCARRANIVLLAAKGWSYRQIREALLPLLGERVSAATVSRVARTLDAAVAAFHRRPLANRYRALLLDGVSVGSQ